MVAAPLPLKLTRRYPSLGGLWTAKQANPVLCRKYASSRIKVNNVTEVQQ